MEHFIAGLVCCLDPGFMSAAQVVLFQQLTEAEYGIYVSSADKIDSKEMELFSCDDCDGYVWVFTYCAHDSNAEDVIAETLEKLVSQGIVYDYTLQYYVLEYYIPKSTFSHN